MEESAFKLEQERLEFIRQYMSVVIDTARTSKERFLAKMKETFADTDWEENTEYGQLLTTATFYQMSNDEWESLKRALPKPYFARVDFVPSEAGQAERLYIGKTSLFQRDNQEQLIIDWRSPIANLYYDGRLGHVSYTSEGETYDGEITLKRQLMIEDGELVDLRDIDLTTVDELLQETLAKSSASRLTEIVETIQEEQNEIIRADLNKPIIVQGAAGSGKTTIALHRISYFLYHYKDVFNPADLLILTPTVLFMEYIQEALPDLGAERVRQATYAQYVEEAIGKRIPLAKDEKLTEVLSGGNSTAKLSRIKGSSLFQQILDHFCEEIKSGLYFHEDFKVDKFKLYPASKLNHLLTKEYTYLPLYKRVDKLKSLLQQQVKRQKDEMLKKITAHYDGKIEKGLNFKGDERKRKAYISEVLKRKDMRLTAFKDELRNTVPRYIRLVKKSSTFTHYKDLFSNPERMYDYAGGALMMEDAADLCAYSQQIFAKRKYEIEDLGPLLYLHAKLYGVHPDHRAKNVVIDEAQDYSFMQIAALKTALETDMFTLVGDLAQGIHSYRSITSWKEISEKIFPRASYKELKKSYRTTIEIMNEANKLLDKLPYDFPVVEPIVRHGEMPRYIQYENIEQWAEGVARQTAKWREEGYHTFAIITKTASDARIAHKVLHENGYKACLLEEKMSIPKDEAVIVPSYLSKGLEFDCVIAFSYDEVYREENETDLKLLYVTMTRAMHRLQLTSKEEGAFILG
ncbi:RNA polymerase recycling motor HelD [Pradoshia eiseniae]|uniref:RNA polymerase recycling motor HelD n=1 Tax=Pradoshia eiseniae TaxID=2064768 RepID=UPI001EFF6AB2|nr:RNA polymerase recycling motor HelD [Pradoshia eiseniae]